jgi:hypothetical protein
MNADQMRSTLTAFAQALEYAGCRASGEQLRRLAQLFEDAGQITVSRLVEKVERNWTLSRRDPRYPAELWQTLQNVRNCLATAGAKTQAADLDRLYLLFRGAPDQPIANFVADAIAARNAVKVKARTPDEAGAERLADELVAAMNDRTEFDALLALLDRTVTVDGVKKVAARFLDRKVTEKGKDAIVDAMRSQQRQDELNRDRTAAQAKVHA